eukprot:8899974-Karenia_brevis.AAC.1
MHGAISQQVWQGDTVVAPQLVQQYDRDYLVHISSSTNIMSLGDMYSVDGIQDFEQHPPLPPPAQ